MHTTSYLNIWRVPLWTSTGQYMPIYVEENLHTVRTPHHACAVAWCPSRDLLAVANYEYLDNERHGSTLLYRYSTGLELVSSSPALVGVYDIAWADDSMLACVTGDGRVVTMAVSEDDALIHVSSTKPLNTVFTSVEWDIQSRTSIVAEQSGSVSIWQPGFDDPVERWLAHRYRNGAPAEVWCATRRDDVVISGGDDSAVTAWDLRDGPRPIFSNTKHHEAGVTALHSIDENRFLTGSYDQRASVWDRRSLVTPTHTLHLDGAPWSFRRHRGYLLVPLLSAGAALFTLHSHLTIVACYTASDPEAIVYGADLYRGASHHLAPLCACCSFYDNRVALFSLPVELFADE